MLVVHRRIRAVLALSAAAVAAASPARAQEAPLPPDPAIAQYVESEPTSTGAKARVPQGGENALSGTSQAAPEAGTAQLFWLAAVLGAVTVVAVVLAASRRRRQRE